MHGYNSSRDVDGGSFTYSDMVCSPQAGQIGNQHAFLRYNIQKGTQQDTIHSGGMLRNEPGNSSIQSLHSLCTADCYSFRSFVNAKTREKEREGEREGGRKAAALRLRKGSRMNESLSFPKRRKVASAENSSKTEPDRRFPPLQARPHSN